MIQHCYPAMFFNTQYEICDNIHGHDNRDKIVYLASLLQLNCHWIGCHGQLAAADIMLNVNAMRGNLEDHRLQPAIVCSVCFIQQAALNVCTAFDEIKE
jgi:hypothetical protein